MNIDAMLKAYLLNINEDIMTLTGRRPMVKTRCMNIKLILRRSRVAESASRRDVFLPLFLPF